MQIKPPQTCRLPTCPLALSSASKKGELVLMKPLAPCVVSRAECMSLRIPAIPELRVCDEQAHGSIGLLQLAKPREEGPCASWVLPHFGIPATTTKDGSHSGFHVRSGAKLFRSLRAGVADCRSKSCHSLFRCLSLQCCALLSFLSHSRPTFCSTFDQRCWSTLFSSRNSHWCCEERFKTGP